MEPQTWHHLSSGCQNPSQEGSCMTRTSQECASLAIGRLMLGVVVVLIPLAARTLHRRILAWRTPHRSVRHLPWDAWCLGWLSFNPLAARTPHRRVIAWRAPHRSTRHCHWVEGLVLVCYRACSGRDSVVSGITKDKKKRLTWTQDASWVPVPSLWLLPVR